MSTAIEDERSRADTQSGHAQGRIGWFLVWAVVFADLGTSVYYTPGILFSHPSVGRHTALFVALSLLVFILLTRKYAEVAVRYPGGGGVVTVSTDALHPYAGLLGGLFILVDYFLTMAISALSGITYLSDVVPSLRSIVLLVTLFAVALLGVLNLIGISESAKVSAAFAIVAATSQLAVVLAVIVRVGPVHLLAALPRVLSGPHLTPLALLTGYAAAFLAFSGLETFSQVSAAMAEPRRHVARWAMGLLIASMLLTAPLLTLFSTTVLPVTKRTDPNQFISLLGGYAAGRLLEIVVAVSGALLLVFACNTALIGAYHIFLALARLGFLPRMFERRNRLRGTPHWAILVAVTIPLLVLIVVGNRLSLLGDLYAFGLLGSFSMTCLSLDIVRWYERHPEQRTAEEARGKARAGSGPIGRVAFAVGVLTTVLIVLAWTTNLVAKPLATLFGGCIILVGALVALATITLARRRGRTGLFPLLYQPGFPVNFLSGGRRAGPPATVLAALPQHPAQVGALVRAAHDAAAGGAVVLMRRGGPGSRTGPPRIFEIVDPYRDDPTAEDVFAEAERLARQHGWAQRYLYLPSTAGPDVAAGLWHALQPKEALAVAGEDDILSNIPVAEVRRSTEETVPILHYVSSAA